MAVSGGKHSNSFEAVIHAVVCIRHHTCVIAFWALNNYYTGVVLCLGGGSYVTRMVKSTYRTPLQGVCKLSPLYFLSHTPRGAKRGVVMSLVSSSALAGPQLRERGCVLTTIHDVVVRP